MKQYILMMLIGSMPFKLTTLFVFKSLHKVEDRRNYNELTMLPKAAISKRGIFRETRETGNSDF